MSVRAMMKTIAGRISRNMTLSPVAECFSSGQVQGGDHEVDRLDADERNDDAADAVDQQVPPQQRVISSCLPISTTSISLVGLESRSTMLPASRAAWVPVFMATPTSA